MSKLPRVSGPDTVAALKKIGFYVRRQQGSHIIL
jgi:predicted RNA binding protein YcfA (HicA-like mRNA interferase family)